MANTGLTARSQGETAKCYHCKVVGGEVIRRDNSGKRKFKCTNPNCKKTFLVYPPVPELKAS